MLTIGQLADFAGVTIRTVRHYHQCGLLAEPERDASGYRRYDANDVVRLIRIRTLADAGVPLARVQDLLHADAADFAAAVDQIDRALQERVAQLEEHRRRVRTLSDSDGLALPSEVIDYLDKLRAIGVSERTVRIERDGWILLSARLPERVAEWIGMKTVSLADPDYRSLYLDLDAALDWTPDDPRLVQLADDLVAYVRRVEGEEPPAGHEDVSAELAALLDRTAVGGVRSWRRLAELVVERGVIGWTNVHTEDADPNRARRTRRPA